MAIEFVIGERLNGSIIKRDGSLGRVGSAIEKKQRKYLSSLAKRQVEAGADYLDVHCGSPGSGEFVGRPEAMEWLVKTVQKAVSVPLCIDSDNVEILEAGFRAYDYDKGGMPILNSVASERADDVLGLLKREGFECLVILNSYVKQDAGAYATAEELLEEAQKLVDLAEAAGIPRSRMLVDPGMNPIIAPYAAYQSLEAIRLIKENIEGVRTTLGVSNVSFGVPNRKFVNAQVLFLAIEKGLDSVVLDPTDSTVMLAVKLGNALAAGKEAGDPFAGMMELSEYTNFCKELEGSTG